MHPDLKSIMITKEELASRVAELGAQITEDYKGKSILMVCILRGAVVFFADLIRHIDLDVSLDFMSVSSYGSGSSTSGAVRINKDIDKSIEGKHLIIVEDIIDSGRTLKHLKQLLSSRAPASIKICSLLDKPSRREVDFQGDYIGFSVPNEFIVGYGLDYAEKYRNLPEVAVLKEEIFAD
ncbi:MAG: hypoxanthine phosphoribosyltransferase [Bacillota bacterium]